MTLPGRDTQGFVPAGHTGKAGAGSSARVWLAAAMRLSDLVPGRRGTGLDPITVQGRSRMGEWTPVFQRRFGLQRSDPCRNRPIPGVKFLHRIIRPQGSPLIGWLHSTQPASNRTNEAWPCSASPSGMTCINDRCGATPEPATIAAIRGPCQTASRGDGSGMDLIVSGE